VALPLMHEETGVCPYVDRCRDIRTLRRVEEQLIQERRGYFSRDEAYEGDVGEALEVYRRSLESVGRAMERCRGGYRRCLRFWQLRRREEEEAYVVPMMGVGVRVAERSQVRG